MTPQWRRLLAACCLIVAWAAAATAQTPSPVSEPEITDFTLRLEHTYRDWNGAPARDVQTWVDPTGQQVWLRTYLDLRRVGTPHERAARLIENEIDRIVGRPPRWGSLDPVPPPAPTHRYIRGQLRVRGTGYADDDGPIEPVCVHFGEAFSAYVRDPEAVRTQLRSLAEKGYQCVRFWDVLGYYDSAWRGREVTPIAFTSREGRRIPATPQYYQTLAAFLRDLDALKLKADHSRGDQNAWSRQEKRDHVLRVADVYRTVGAQVAALFEVSNESWQNGVDDVNEAADLLALFKGAHPQILGGLSCPPGATEEAADLRAWSRSPADVIIVHGHRTGSAGDKIRHVFSLRYEGRPEIGNGKPFWQTEPTGPGAGVTVGREERPEVLSAMAAVALMTGQAWNYMCGPCVFWDGAGSIDRMPGLAAVASVRAFLPDDVGLYEDAYHGGRTQAVLTSPSGFPSDGRIDQVVSHSRGRLVAVVYGGDGRVRARRHVRGTVHDPDGGDAPYAFELGAGQEMTLRYEHARVIVAELVE